MSLDRESELALAADAPAAQAFLDARGGRLHSPVENDPAAWWAQIHPAAEPGETYYARIGWTAYPGAAPSVKFAQSLGAALNDPTAWPQAPGYRPTQLDICKPFTAEGFALHPDWITTSQTWSADGNPFLAVVRELQRNLNSPGYDGRYRA
jgi:hypothetical protein